MANNEQVRLLVPIILHVNYLSYNSNIILLTLLCYCRLYVVVSCGSVSFEYKQVVKALLIFHRPAAEGLVWWWGEVNEFFQHFHTSILQKRAIYIQNCPHLCHKTCLCPGLVQSAGSPISFLQIAHILASSSNNQTLLDWHLSFVQFTLHL